MKRPSAGQWLLLGVFLATLPLVTLKVRGADEIQYFSHLRSAVFDHDFDFADEYEHFYQLDPQGLAGFKGTFLDKREPLTGRRINFAPIGTAVLWSPFYLLAHAGLTVARALGASVEADGYSRPYVAAVCYASALYALLGLLLIHDGLTRVGGFADRDAALALAALWLGSPLLYYVSLAPAFSHACSLFALALVVWLWLRLRGRPASGVGGWALLGAAVGLAGLVREQDALIVVLPGLELARRLWRDRDWGGVLARGLALGVGAWLVFLPQLFAYRAINGAFGPSRLVTQKMRYSSPHFLQVLFDPGHGLFVWCPLLLLAALGLLLAWRRGDGAVPALAAALLLTVWINGSVESWSVAGAFGARRFVGMTVVFAWGLAALVEAARPRLGTPALAAALAVFVWWNVSL
ncbi:MAG TPA: hypothetical protein VF310_05630, partial [Vicinamibacteria bacterium]